MLYWVNSVMGMFGACDLFWGVSIVEGSCSASPLLSIFSLVVFFTAAHVAAGAGGFGTVKSVEEKAVVASSVYVANGFSSLWAATITSAVSLAAGGETSSPATCGELWATLVFVNVAFSGAAAMSTDADAALGGAEAMVLVVVPSFVSGFSVVPLCLSCCACILCISGREQLAMLCVATLLPNIVLLGKVEQQTGGRAVLRLVVSVGCPL